MKWKDLITIKRLKSETSHKSEFRSAFEIDTDRILFSSPFRRLQDKTQVFPISENDNLHNRLTHTLEVASTGKSLGRLIGRELLKKYTAELKGYTEHDFGSIVFGACLIHDIGNPPFGHAGEKAISEYFKYGSGQWIYQRFYIPDEDHPNHPQYFNQKKWNDLLDFEGNAQGFRIITAPKDKAFNLTLTTLAASIKYPKESLISTKFQTSNDWRASSHKYGFFQSEKSLFLKVVKSLNLTQIGDKDNIYYLRHPLAFVVEAADDICNLLIDLEDSAKQNLIPINDAERILSKIAGIGLKSLKLKNANRNERLGILRRNAILTLIDEAKVEFLKNEVKIRNGKYDYEMVEKIKSYPLLNEIKQLRKSCTFCCPTIVQREATGYEILKKLTEYYTDAVNTCETCNLTSYHKEKIEQMIPVQFLDTSRPKDDKYIDDRIRLVIDYISGMTDTYSFKTFKLLSGIEI